MAPTHTEFVFAPRIPPGLGPAVEGLAREILRHRPRDVYAFAARHFHRLIVQSRENKVVRDCEPPIPPPTIVDFAEKTARKESAKKLSTTRRKRATTTNRSGWSVHPTVEAFQPNKNNYAKASVLKRRRSADPIERTSRASEDGGNVPSLAIHRDPSSERYPLLRRPRLRREASAGDERTPPLRDPVFETLPRRCSLRLRPENDENEKKITTPVDVDRGISENASSIDRCDDRCSDNNSAVVVLPSVAARPSSSSSSSSSTSTSTSTSKNSNEPIGRSNEPIGRTNDLVLPPIAGDACRPIDERDDNVTTLLQLPSLPSNTAIVTEISTDGRPTTMSRDRRDSNCENEEYHHRRWSSETQNFPIARDCDSIDERDNYNQRDDAIGVVSLERRSNDDDDEREIFGNVSETEVDEIFNDSLNITPDSIEEHSRRSDSLERENGCKGERENEEIILEHRQSSELKKKLIELETVERSIEHTLVASSSSSSGMIVPRNDDDDESAISSTVVKSKESSFDLRDDETILLNGERKLVVGPDEETRASLQSDHCSSSFVVDDDQRYRSSSETRGREDDKDEEDNVVVIDFTDGNLKTSDDNDGDETTNDVDRANVRPTTNESSKEIDLSSCCYVVAGDSPCEVSEESVTTVIISDKTRCSDDENDDDTTLDVDREMNDENDPRWNHGSLQRLREQRRFRRYDNNHLFGEYVGSRASIVEYSTNVNPDFLNGIKKNLVDRTYYLVRRDDLKDVREEEEIEVEETPDKDKDKDNADEFTVLLLPSSDAVACSVDSRFAEMGVSVTMMTTESKNENVEPTTTTESENKNAEPTTSTTMVDSTGFNRNDDVDEDSRTTSSPIANTNGACNTDESLENGTTTTTTTSRSMNAKAGVVPTESFVHLNERIEATTATLEDCSPRRDHPSSPPSLSTVDATGFGPFVPELNLDSLRDATTTSSTSFEKNNDDDDDNDNDSRRNGENRLEKEDDGDVTFHESGEILSSIDDDDPSLPIFEAKPTVDEHLSSSNSESLRAEQLSVDGEDRMVTIESKSDEVFATAFADDNPIDATIPIRDNGDSIAAAADGIEEEIAEELIRNLTLDASGRLLLLDENLRDSRETENASFIVETYELRSSDHTNPTIDDVTALHSSIEPSLRRESLNDDFQQGEKQQYSTTDDEKRIGREDAASHLSFPEETATTEFHDIAENPDDAEQCSIDESVRDGTLDATVGNGRFCTRKFVLEQCRHHSLKESEEHPPNQCEHSLLTTEASGTTSHLHQGNCEVQSEECAERSTVIASNDQRQRLESKEFEESEESTEGVLLWLTVKNRDVQANQMNASPPIASSANSSFRFKQTGEFQDFLPLPLFEISRNQATFERENSSLRFSFEPDARNFHFQNSPAPSVSCVVDLSPSFRAIENELTYYWSQYCSRNLSPLCIVRVDRVSKDETNDETPRLFANEQILSSDPDDDVREPLALIDETPKSILIEEISNADEVDHNQKSKDYSLNKK